MRLNLLGVRPIKGENCQNVYQVNGNIMGCCKDSNSSWHLIGFPDESSKGSTI